MLLIVSTSLLLPAVSKWAIILIEVATLRCFQCNRTRQYWCRGARFGMWTIPRFGMWASPRFGMWASIWEWTQGLNYSVNQSIIDEKYDDFIKSISLLSDQPFCSSSILLIFAFSTHLYWCMLLIMSFYILFLIMEFSFISIL